MRNIAYQSCLHGMFRNVVSSSIEMIVRYEMQPLGVFSVESSLIVYSHSFLFPLHFRFVFFKDSQPTSE